MRAGKIFVLAVLLVMVAGAVAYWQGYLEIGIDTEKIQERLGGTLSEGGSANGTQRVISTPAPGIIPAPDTRVVPASQKQEPVPTPMPTDLPVSLQNPEPSPMPTAVPTTTPIPTPSAAPPPVPTATPSLTPTPATIPVEVTSVSFAGISYTLYLKAAKIPGGGTQAQLKTLVSHGDGTIDEALTFFNETNIGDYFGAVIVDQDRIYKNNLQWVRDNITVEILLEKGEDRGLALTPASTPAPRRSGTPVSAVHPTPALSLRHSEEKRYMLELINAERGRADVPPVVLGNNRAAQLHAESSLENCTSSHWGIDGLKPYMRYSLAGGYQSNGENNSGLDYCITRRDGYRALGSVEAEIRETMAGWMNSPGHRRNILGRWHKKVNIGLAWDHYNFKAVQHFEGDYVEYDRLPAIENGMLSLAGETKNGLRFAEEQDLGVQVYYDPPPHRLTRRQVSATYCYDSGRLAASLREPLTAGWYYNEDKFTKTYQPCPNPYDVSPEAPSPESHDDAHQSWQEAYNASQRRKPQTITVPWITASRWTANGKTFAVTADLIGVLREHGDGVYTVLLWGNTDGDDVVISQYSIFHGVTPPDTYSINR